MRQRFIKLSLLFSFALLSACANKVLTMDSISSIQKGISPEEVQQITARKPSNQAEFIENGQHYFTDLYAMQVGSDLQTTFSCTQYGCFPITVNVPITEAYLMIYDAQKMLLTWGFHYEGARTEYADVFNAAFKALSKPKKKADQ